jgi:hypothetical protein
MSDQTNAGDGSEATSGADPVEPTSAAAPTTAATAAATSSSWPTGAKTTAGILAVIAVAAIISAIVGFSRASSSEDDADALATDLDAATARADAAEQERDALAAEATEAESAVDALTAERDDLSAARDEALAANDQLTSDLADATERAETAETQLEAIGGVLPVSIDSSLIPEEGDQAEARADLVGTYSITYAEAYCDGFPTCGTVPTVDEARIYETSDGFLRVEVPGILDAGLFALDGSLYGITDSFTALPQCGGVDQRARVTITLYARGITIDEDGSRAVDTINADVTIDTPSGEPGCPSGLVFYASTFTPVG